MANTWLKFFLSRRYSINISGDSIPKNKQLSSTNSDIHAFNSINELDNDLDLYTNKDTLENSKNFNAEEQQESFLFIINYSSLLNPLLFDLCLNKHKACYCMTKPQKSIKCFFSNISKIISNPEAKAYDKQNINEQKNEDANVIINGEHEKNIDKLQNEKIQNAHINSKKYLKAGQETIEQAVQAINAHENIVIWTSDELQKNEHEVINNCIAFNVLKHLQANNMPLPELFLSRIDGVWGSSFSRYNKDNIPTFFASLFKKIHLLLLGPFLKRRPVQITFRRHKLSPADLNSQEIFNNLIKNWFTANNKGALIVPNLCFYKNKYMPITMPDTIKIASPNTNIVPKKLKIVEKLIHVQTEQEEYNFIPKPEEQAKKSQDMPILAEISPAIIRTPPQLVIQHATTRQGHIVDINEATYNSRRVLFGLAKAISSTLTELSACHNVGIALPIGIGSMAAFISIFDCNPQENRLPVMLDYTLDSKDFEQCTQIADIKIIITSKALSDFVLPSEITPIYIEDISPSQITKGELASFIGFAGNTDIDSPAVMLFNNDNDVLKAFTLSHRNLLSCLGDIIQVCAENPINANNFSLLCCLPTYTSLGLLNNIILPLTCGIPTVTVPHTHDIELLTRTAENYNVNLFIGTSSTLEKILRNALIHLPFRYAIVHTDSDMSYIYNHFSEICPDAILIQAYSVNECSSIISLNPSQHPNSIGKILPSLDYLIHNELLYVRGPSIFSGYLNEDSMLTSVDASSHYQDWLCLNTKVKDDEDEFLYKIETAD